MRFEHDFSVNAPVERVWDFLMDVPRMAVCIPGTSAITPVDERNYDATVVTKIGPISARFGCRITVVTLDPVAHAATIELSGKDNRLGGGVRGKMAMTLSGSVDGTMVRIVSDVDVLGKIGQYGHGVIAKRADAMLTDFAGCARAALAAPGAVP